MRDECPRRRELLKGLGAAVFVATPAAVGTGRADDAFFEVSASHSQDVVSPGETTTVTGEISNTGGEAGTQVVSVELKRDGDVEDVRESFVTLEPGESETRTETIEYAEYPEPGEYVGQVCTDDDCDEESWTVQGEDDGDNGDGTAVFEVDLVDHTETVEGGPIEVTVEVANTGDGDGEQTISLEVSELGEVDETVSLDSGATTEVTLTLPTAVGDSGEYEGTVSSADDTVETELTVEPAPASFELEVVEVTDPRAGEPAEVTVSVTNSGGEAGEQTVALTLPEIGDDSTTAELESEESTDVTLTVPTDVGDSGDSTATVTTDDDEVETTVTIETAPPRFVIEDAEATTPVAGETLELTATVSNDGGEPDEQPVDATLDGLGADTTAVELDAGETATVELTVDTEPGDSGEYTAVLETADDETEFAVTVDPEPAVFVLGDADTSEPVAGDPLEVTVDVTNEGGEAGAATVELVIDELGSAEESIDVPARETETVTLALETTAEDAGEYDLALSTGDDTVEREVTVDAASTPDDEGGGGDDGTDDRQADDGADDDGAGFGLLSAAGGGVAYLLTRRLRSATGEDEN